MSKASSKNPEEEWREVRDRLFALYSQREYGQALAGAVEAGERFPERRNQTLFWRSCLCSRLGDIEGALAALEEGLHEGFWWGEGMLRGDEDLAPLRTLPAFESIVEQCEWLGEAARAQARAELLLFGPHGGHETSPLVVALHGRGGNARDFAPYWRHLTGKGYVVAIPQSSQLSAAGMHCWDDRERAGTELHGALTDALTVESVDEDRIVLAGYSQGGALAVAEALRGERIRCRGFLAVAPSFGLSWANTPAVADLRPMLRASAKRGLRGAVLTGEEDPLLAGAEELRNEAKSAELPLRLEVDCGRGHDFPDDFQPRLSRALTFVLGENRTAA